MVKNAERLKEWEEEFSRNNPLSFEQKLKIVDSLWKEAIDLGVIDKNTVLEGIEDVIEFKRRVNCLKKYS